MQNLEGILMPIALFLAENPEFVKSLKLESIKIDKFKITSFE